MLRPISIHFALLLAGLAAFLCVGCDGPGAANSDVWTAPTAAPKGSPVALHGRLRVPTIAKVGTQPNTDAGATSPPPGDGGGVDAGAPGDSDGGADGGTTVGSDAGASVGADGGAPVDPDAGTSDGGALGDVDAGSVSDNDAGTSLPGADAGAVVLMPQLIDEHGDPVQLKGVSSNWLQWETQPYAESKSGLQFMRDNWKVSLIRAAMGTDQSGGYLGSGKAGLQGRVEAIVRNAIDLGVYVIVDWHTEQAVNQTDASVAFFKDMSTKYGKYPNVIFEPYNEPNGPAWPEIKVYHEAVVAAIRGIAPDNLIVLGTPNWSQDVDVAAGDPVEGTNLLYTLHFYACTHKASLRAKADHAIAAGAAIFVTEFGATPADGGSTGDNKICEAEANTWFSWMSANTVSGASWKLESCSDSSCLLAAGAPADGPWTDTWLSNDASSTPVAGGVMGGGQGVFIADWLRQ